MTKMKPTLLIIALGLIIALAGCSSPTETPVNAQPTQSPVNTQLTQAPVDTQPTESTLTLTTAELAAFNGKNGNPAYIAINGVIYDVSNVPEWMRGMHQGFDAGQDLTAQMEKAPHGLSMLRGIPVVGALAN